MRISDLCFEEEEEATPGFLDEMTRKCPECGDTAYRNGDAFICFGCGWRGE